MADSNSLNIVSSLLRGDRGPNEWGRDFVERTVTVDEVRQGVLTFLKQIQTIFTMEQDLLGQFMLDEVRVVAQVNPEGQFTLVGANSENCHGGITFVLKRQRTLPFADQHLVSSNPNTPELKAVLGSSVDSDTVKVKLVQSETVTLQIPTPITVVGT
jgi:hypothetical protein